MAKPRAIENGVPAWWDTPEKRERLEAYCKQDVVLEREVYKRLRPLPEAEQRIWCLDAAINERGVFVDEPAAKTALAVVQRQQVEECAKVWHLTGGEVNGPSEVKRLTDWITAHGVDIPSLAKQDIIDTLATVSSGQSGIAHAGSYAGNYTLSGASDHDYAFSYVSGDLTDRKRAV